MATTCFKPRQSRSETPWQVLQIVRFEGTQKIKPSLTLLPFGHRAGSGKPCHPVNSKPQAIDIYGF